MTNLSSCADLGEWAFIELTGKDRLEWLQGQATNDLRGVVSGQRTSFCLCEPTGQLLAVLDAWALDDRIVMSTARERASLVLARIERMTIMEEVEARLLSDQAFTIQGRHATEELGRLLDRPVVRAGTVPLESAEVLILNSERTPTGGWDLLLPEGAESLRLRLTERFQSAKPEEWEAARIEAGIPKWGVDMGPRTLPPELGPDFEARHVSYQKGCYVGQEVLMRMHSRGHTNRTWVGLVSHEPIRVGASVVHEGQEVGRVSSASAWPASRGGYVGAATLRNEATAEGTEVTIDGLGAEVRRMPISRAA